MKKICQYSLITALLLSLTQLNAEELQNEQATQGESLFSEGVAKDNAINGFIKDNFSNDDLNNHPQLNNSFQNYTETNNQNDELNLMKNAIRNQDLKALQQNFFSKKYSGYENTKNLYFQADKTQKIRTRFAMATTLIFQSDIESYILGDNTGFKVEEIPNLPNAIAIKPLLIGIDTSLTIFTRNHKLHSFYLYSTDYKSSKNPDLVVYIQDEQSKKEIQTQQEELNKDYLTIKEGIAEVKVKKSDIYSHYEQKAKKENAWLLAEEIFNDKQFTYFKYDKEKMPQIPSVFVVIDKQDSPIETRVINNYIIAETTARKFTIMLGDSYVCVERIEPKDSGKK